MPGYSSSSETMRARRPSNPRTMNWIQNAPRQNIQFCSPSIPPSPQDDINSISEFSDSDAESSHSTPPRMVMRYPDGRDIHLSEDRRDHSSSRHIPAHLSSEQGHSHSRSRSASVSHRDVPDTLGGERISRSGSRSGPHSRAPQPNPQASFAAPSALPARALSSSRLPAHPPRPHTTQPTTIRPQEDIRILPTHHNVTPHAAYPQNKHQSSHSHVQNLISPNSHRAYTPSHHTLLAASQLAVTQSQPSSHIRNLSTPGPISHSQSHPPSKHGRMPVRAPEPRYQPSKLSNNTFAPPVNGHGPSSRTADGHLPVTYSDSSSPNHPRSHARSGSGTRSRNPITGPLDSWPVIDEEVNRRRDASRSQHQPQRPSYSHHGRRRDTSPLSDESPPHLDYSRSRTPSSGSQSTYFIAASPENQVKHLPTEKPVYHSVSNNKSPTSAHVHDPPSQWTNQETKKPFLSRLFGGSSSKKPVETKSLARRHSFGAGVKRH